MSKTLVSKPIAAISLPREVITINQPTVCCNGGGGPKNLSGGHPAVYLTVARDTGQVTCKYCGRVYVLTESAPQTGGH